MEWIAKILIFLIGVYWTGDRVKSNPHVGQLLTEAEGGFSSLILSLKALKMPDALKFLSKVYCVLTIVSFCTLLALSEISVQTGVKEIVLLIFGTSFLMYSSLGWVLSHKNVIKSNWLMIFIFLSWPFFMGWLEFSQGIPVLNDPFLTMNRILVVTNIGDLSGIGVWWQAVALSGFSAILLIFYYVIAWLGALLFTSISVFLVLIPVYLAKLIHRFFPNDSFFFFTIILFGLLTIFS
ncbi:hypothetical protein [Vibrio sp. Hep-1b-8]|uniref:hypothetical protein n=1 Tax=Vibrio sp. Hep-1b-8 TaxID=2144187 RepID=UPI0011109E09|nr:hypothetical protein [Vibrio sp. Hep-1b-8]TMX38346.1 hypothetical protein DA100_10320 [Vibrio sp. Hep-1b-8]